jgi:hypothetical protein
MKQNQLPHICSPGKLGGERACHVKVPLCQFKVRVAILAFANDNLALTKHRLQSPHRGLVHQKIGEIRDRIPGCFNKQCLPQDFYRKSIALNFNELLVNRNVLELLEPRPWTQAGAL